MSAQQNKRHTIMVGETAHATITTLAGQLDCSQTVIVEALALLVPKLKMKELQAEVSERKSRRVRLANMIKELSPAQQAQVEEAIAQVKLAS